MKQYLDLLQDILDNGVWQNNRTAIRTKMIPGAMIKFDLRKGFPAVTTKKLAFNAVKGELIGFINGFDTAKQFRDHGCKVWDQNSSNPNWLNNIYNLYWRLNKLENWRHKHPNATDSEINTYGKTLTEEGYLGRIYGKQWTDWKCSDGNGSINQIKELVNKIKSDPTSRRLLVSAWRPDELEEMALPPCHYSFQLIIEQESKVMHLLWNQRSVDTFLGLPFNIASYATLLSLLAKATGYTAGTLTGMLADVHIYENHLDQINEQLSREPLPLCQLHIDEVTTTKASGLELTDFYQNGINLVNYVSHEAIKAPMAD